MNLFNLFQKISKFFFIGIAILLSCLVIIIGVSFSYLDKNGPLKSSKTVIIESGTTIDKIAQGLSDEGIIKYPTLFSLIARIETMNNRFKAGEYKFHDRVSPNQVISIIKGGKSITHKLVIPEGTLTIDIIKMVDEETLLKGQIIETYKDGDLLPDTYHFVYGDKKQDLLRKMKRKQELLLEALWLTKKPDLPFTSKKQALTLASIVEKETSKEKERKRIAAVFINRLKKNMKLQADPTVIYAITEGKRVLERNLTYNDLKYDSEYNTYLYKGLPPSPITNPGKASIEAVFDPVSSEEIYFVANGKGGHIFASNIKDHVRNVRKYRKLMKRKIVRK